MLLKSCNKHKFNADKDVQDFHISQFKFFGHVSPCCVYQPAAASAFWLVFISNLTLIQPLFIISTLVD